MFDWSRGSVLKAMQQAQIPHAAYDPWLKGFAYAWLHAVLHFERGGRVIDVGCGATPAFLEDLRLRYNVEAHGLDKSERTAEGHNGWGLSDESRKKFPHVTFHGGFAGEHVAPGEHFDAVLSVSALEHIYDTIKPVDRSNMYPHYRALDDMCRMVKPGGILAFTYDFPLCYPYNPGWSPQADYEFLLSSGLQPCVWKRLPVSETFIYNHADTLFVQPDGILSFCDYYFRIAIICFAFQKPGRHLARVQYQPNRAVIAALAEDSPAEYPTVLLEESKPAAAPGSKTLLREWWEALRRNVRR